MRLRYNTLGKYIQEINVRNTDLAITNLLGVSMEKTFIPSVANLNGVDLSIYKVLSKDQLACKLMSVGRDEKLPVDLYKDEKPAIVSSAYYVFEPKDKEELLPEYLMMWLCRAENDRFIGFISGGDVRGGISWDTFCGLPIRVPKIDKQRELVKEYNVIQNRITLNQQLIQKLEETAQAIYREWFVEGIDLENLPEGWAVDELKNMCTKIGSGSTPTGGKESYSSSGISLIRSTNVFDYNFSYEDLAFIDEHQADKLKNVEVREKDILFNITGVSVARCCMIPSNVLPARVNQHVMIIRPENKLNISFYLLMNLCSTDSKNTLLGISQSGSTREAITKTEIEDFEIILPESGILEKFERQMQKIFSLKDLKSLENQKLTELKELMLSKLATI